MREKRWLEETDPTRLMLKLHEEVGEITHAFIREETKNILAEIEDTRLILKRLKEVIKHGS